MVLQRRVDDLAIEIPAIENRVAHERVIDAVHFALGFDDGAPRLLNTGHQVLVADGIAVQE